MSLKTFREVRSTTEYEPVDKSVVSTTATLVVGRGIAAADTRASPLAATSRSVLSPLVDLTGVDGKLCVVLRTTTDREGAAVEPKGAGTERHCPTRVTATRV